MSDNNLSKEYLLIKSDGVEDCVAWLEKKLKKQKQEVKHTENLYRGYGIFEDCGDSYKQNFIESKSKLETMVNIKVSLQKYMKKLRCEADEIEMQEE